MSFGRPVGEAVVIGMFSSDPLSCSGYVAGIYETEIDSEMIYLPTSHETRCGQLQFVEPP